ncbi:MAG: hypothetical protein HC850_05670, partial [Rhodomicrobium sp.]|nr:hypothetical protein [Rhodomicrobium sp.]
MATSILGLCVSDYSCRQNLDLYGRAKHFLAQGSKRGRILGVAAIGCTLLSCIALPNVTLAVPAGKLSAQYMGNAAYAMSAQPRFIIQIQTSLGELRVADVSGAPGQPIPLNIELVGANDTEQLFILRGIPEGVKLTPGGSVGTFWAVNSKVISAITLTAPPDFSGSFTVSISRTRDPADPALKTYEGFLPGFTVGMPLPEHMAMWI